MWQQRLCRCLINNRYAESKLGQYFRFENLMLSSDYVALIPRTVAISAQGSRSHEEVSDFRQRSAWKGIPICGPDVVPGRSWFGAACPPGRTSGSPTPPGGQDAQCGQSSLYWSATWLTLENWVDKKKLRLRKLLNCFVVKLLHKIYFIKITNIKFTSITSTPA